MKKIEVKLSESVNCLNCLIAELVNWVNCLID